MSDDKMRAEFERIVREEYDANPDFFEVRGRAPTFEFFKIVWQAARQSEQGGEAVATVEVWNPGGSGEFVTAEGINKLPHGTKLYTAPQPAVPEGWKLVPVEPTKGMLNQAADNLCGEFGTNYVATKEDFSKAAYREFIEAAPEPPEDV